MPTPLLQVTDLSIALPTAQGLVQAVCGVSFTLGRGQTLGLVGESGSGKSLTALALLGLLPEGAQVRGSIRLDGKELLGLPDAALCRIRGRRIGMVFQEPMTALNPLHRIGDQVAEPLRLHQGLGRAAARQQAQALLERVGLPDAKQRLDHYPHEFSGGQRQRITIAMALACGPDVLIADEATTALDVVLQQQILQLLQEVAAERGMALLFISHDLGLIAQNTDHMLVLYGGMVLESGPTTGVFAQLAHPYTRALLAARPVLGAHSRLRQRLPAIAGSLPALADRLPGCPFAGRCEFTLAACQREAPPLQTLSQDGHGVRCLRIETIPSAVPGQPTWRLR